MLRPVESWMVQFSLGFEMQMKKMQGMKATDKDTIQIPGSLYV